MAFASLDILTETIDQTHNAVSKTSCGAANCSALVVDHLTEQGWGKLADGTIVWEDDHRVTPGDCRCLVPETAPR